MAWVKSHTDATNIYWRRVEDGYVIGFNREGIGVPFSREDAPPMEIDVHAPPLNEESIKQGMLEALHAKVAALEIDVATLKKGKA